MKTKSLVLIALVMALTGCTTVKTVDLVDHETLTAVDPDAELSVSERRAQYLAVYVRERQAGSFSRINRLARRKQVLLTLADGRALKVSSLQATPDSTSWFNKDTDRFETVATAEIQEIRFVKRGKGALQGLGLGLLTGAVLGAIVARGEVTVNGATDEQLCGEEGDPFLCYYAVTTKAALAVSMVGLGSLLGPIVGAVLGSKEVYRFNQGVEIPEGAAGEDPRE